MLQDTPPDAILDLAGTPEVRFATSSDLAPDGRPGRHWLLLTGERIVVVEDGEAPRVVLELDTAEVESYRAHAVVGSGFLQARRRRLGGRGALLQHAGGPLRPPGRQAGGAAPLRRVRPAAR